MCGVAGVFNLNQETVSRHVLVSMVDEISHRGPDGQGHGQTSLGRS